MLTTSVKAISSSENSSIRRADIDRRTALKLNPYVDDEEIEAIMRDMDAEEVSGKPSMEELDKMLAAARQVSQE